MILLHTNTLDYVFKSTTNFDETKLLICRIENIWTNINNQKNK